MDKFELSPEDAEKMISVLPQVSRTGSSGMTEIKSAMIAGWLEIHNPNLHVSIKNASRNVYKSVTEDPTIATDPEHTTELSDFQLRGLIARSAFAGASAAIEQICDAMKEVNNLEDLLRPDQPLENQ